MYEILRWMFDKFTKIRYNKKIKKKEGNAFCQSILEWQPFYVQVRCSGNRPLRFRESF